MTSLRVFSCSGACIRHLIACACVSYLAEFRQAYVHACPEAGAQVGWTCEDVAQALIPHEFPASLLNQVFHLWRKIVTKLNKLKQNMLYCDKPCGDLVAGSFYKITVRNQGT